MIDSLRLLRLSVKHLLKSGELLIWQLQHLRWLYNFISFKPATAESKSCHIWLIQLNLLQQLLSNILYYMGQEGRTQFCPGNKTKCLDSREILQIKVPPANQSNNVPFWFLSFGGLGYAINWSHILRDTVPFWLETNFFFRWALQCYSLKWYLGQMFGQKRDTADKSPSCKPTQQYSLLNFELQKFQILSI